MELNQFRIRGLSDSDYNVNPDARRSITVSITMLEGAPVAIRSKQQQCVTLSVTEAELMAGVETAQDMMFIKSVLESIELSIELPMVLEMDNKGAVNLANNWLESSQKNTTCCIKQGSTFYKN